MRSVFCVLAVAASLSISTAGGSFAAAVSGFEAQYNSVTASCTIPTGSLANCRTAINAYSTALIGGGVVIADANISFSAVRKEVFAINAPDAAFQAQVDALFEELLPDSGALTGPAPGAIGAAPGDDVLSLSDAGTDNLVEDPSPSP